MAGTLSYKAVESEKMSAPDTAPYDNDIISFKDYTIIREIGRDEHSVCFLCEKGGIQYVLKKYFSRLSDSMRNMLEKISKSYSSHLAEIVEFDELDGNAYEVQKYYGDLTLENRDTLNISVGTVIHDVNKALSELHSMNIIHNDIKPNNIVVSNGHCILTDYGNITDGARMITSYTVEYAAPEVISSGFAGTASDYFSFGVMIYELTAGTNPFTSMSRYDSMNIKNKERWIVKEVICSEIYELITKLCTSDSRKRWLYSEVSDWYEKYGDLPKVNTPVTQNLSKSVGTITWNGRSYQRYDLPKFVSDLGSNWEKGIAFLFSGEHSKEIRMYSPEIASAIDNLTKSFSNKLNGQSILNYLSNKDIDLCDSCFLKVLINSGVSFEGVYWRGFKGKSINELALEMLNDCFVQYFSQSDPIRRCIPKGSFAGSALSNKVLSTYHKLFSDGSDKSDSVGKMITKCEKDFESHLEHKSAKAAFSLCYELSGSKQFPLLNSRNIDSIDSLHNEVVNALNQDSSDSITQIMAKCVMESEFNAPFCIWISEIASK